MEEIDVLKINGDDYDELAPVLRKKWVSILKLKGKIYDACVQSVGIR